MLTSRPCSCFRRSSSRPLAERAKAGIVQVFAQAVGDLDLDLLRFLLGVRRAEYGVQNVGVEHQRVQIVADSVDVDVAGG